MLVPVCYFSIWFLTAARNTDSAFAICNYTTVLSVNLFILLQHFVDDGSVPLLVAECYLTMSVLHLHFKRLE